MLAANPYLHFMGNTEEAMKFYKSVFGGEFTIFQRFSDVPGSERMPAHEQNMIIHISLALGEWRCNHGNRFTGINGTTA